MDDILVVYAENGRWDTDKFFKDFEASECYQKPLKLEAGAEGTFLETQIETDGRRITTRLKNENQGGRMKVWRYQHWFSNAPFMQKRATLTTCLRKVQAMASGPKQLLQGALDKVAEFRRLRYPLNVLQKACSYLGSSIVGGGHVDHCQERTPVNTERSKGR